MPNMEGVKLVLLDIEGTVCPISFVKDTLFPYAIKALPSVLEQKWSDRSFAPYRDAFPETARASPEALQAHVEDLTRRDVKIAYLKNLQGYLWEDGYKSGAYATPLFPDVAPRLRSWKEDQGFHLAIYSSGSVFAQKLLFEHVDASRARTEAEVKPDTVGEDDGHRGEVQDLTGLFDVDGWFDTTNAGLKTEVSSYATIAQALKFEPATVLFLSDNVKEVDAAIEAGMQSILVDRPGNAPVSDADRSRLHVVASLDEIKLQQDKSQS